MTLGDVTREAKKLGENGAWLEYVPT